MRSLIGIALVVALALGAGWYFMVARGPGSVAVNAATSATTTITVEAAPVKLSAVRRQIEAVGSLRSNESVIIRPEIAGRITEILFDEGQQARRACRWCGSTRRSPARSSSRRSASLVLSRANHERAEDLYRKRRRHAARPRRGAGEAARRRGVRGAGPGDARQVDARRAVRRHDRPAPGQRRRLRQSGPGPRQHREHRIAEGRFPRAGDLSRCSCKVGQTDPDHTRRDSRQRLSTARSTRSTRASTPTAAPSCCARACRTTTASCARACSRASRCCSIDKRRSDPRAGDGARPGRAGQFVYRVVDGKAVLTKIKIGQRRARRRSRSSRA